MLPENKQKLKEMEGSIKKLGQPELYAYPDPNSKLYKTCQKNNVSPYREGYKAITNWQDLNGYPWTIGYGHTRDNIKTYNSKRVNPGDIITQTQADKLLDEDVKYWEHVVDVNSKYFAKSDNQRDAFTIFAYQQGGGRVNTLMSDVYANLSDYKKIVEIWIWYTQYDKGVRNEGSFNRRKKELQIYFGNAPFEITPGIKIVKTEEQKQVQEEKIKSQRAVRYLITTDITIDEFLKNTKSLLPNISKLDFLKFKPEKSSNADQIYSIYSQEEKDTNKTKYSQFDLDYIKANTSIFLPLSELQVELYLTKGKNLFIDDKKDLPVYFSDKQKELEQDPNYVRAERLYQFGDVDISTIEENCQVWLYVKSIDKLLDISSFVNSLTISKTDIGQFSIDLLPIEISINRESNDIEAIFISSTNGREYLNDYQVKQIDGTLNLSFYEKYCQQNDCVFIRFEKLQLEEDVNVTKFGSHQIEVSKVDIPSQIFDMIGLVDNISSNVNFESTDYSVSISGRDLMKTLVEDGAYLIDLTFAKGAENMMFFLGDAQDKSFKRNFVTNGGFEYLFKEFFDPLDTYMGFIVNQLSNVGWTGDNDLFNYYPLDERPQKPRIDISTEQDYLNNVEVNGVWKISHIKVDPKLSDRRVVDASFIDTDGTLYEQFKKVCQSPFVEFWGDTYGSQFNYIARQQPFDLDGMTKIVDGGFYIEIEPQDTFQINLGWEDEFYSWIQFYPNNQAFSNDQYWLSASFPVIYFDKYVEHFGNHRYEIQDNYVSGKSVDVVDGKENKENMAIGLFRDLKYVIETISVLPFTRKGTIVINGDRRIKKGSFVYLKATDEICYVDAVTNSVSFSNNSINRTTILSVKRCMKKLYISGVEGNSYFNVVNSQMITNELIDRFKYMEELEKKNTVVKTTKQIKVDFGVNKDVFDFFLQRRQMDVI